MHSKIISINNVSRLQQAGNALMQRSIGFPGMGLIWGRTGFGKTTAATWMVNKVHGVYVRAWALWTPFTMLEAIARELSLEIRGTCAQRAERIVDRLAATGRPLFVDEADYLLDKRLLVNTLRDLHDLSTVPVILIGMDGIQRRLADNPQLTGRMAQWVEFSPCDLNDARLLCDGLCEVEVAEDLLAVLHADSGGEVRRLVVGLGKIEHLARGSGRVRMTVADWPQGESFFMGGAKAHRAKPVRSPACPEPAEWVEGAAAKRLRVVRHPRGEEERAT